MGTEVGGLGMGAHGELPGVGCSEHWTIGRIGCLVNVRVIFSFCGKGLGLCKGAGCSSWGMGGRCGADVGRRVLVSLGVAGVGGDRRRKGGNGEARRLHFVEGGLGTRRRLKLRGDDCQWLECWNRRTCSGAPNPEHGTRINDATRRGKYAFDTGLPVRGKYRVDAQMDAMVPSLCQKRPAPGPNAGEGAIPSGLGGL